MTTNNEQPKERLPRLPRADVRRFLRNYETLYSTPSGAWTTGVWLIYAPFIPRSLRIWHLSSQRTKKARSINQTHVTGELEARWLRAAQSVRLQNVALVSVENRVAVFQDLDMAQAKFNADFIAYLLREIPNAAFVFGQPDTEELPLGVVYSGDEIAALVTPIVF